ncbi:hypothetical protein FGADI_982 [Fusarium gaditjirri]|uniref:Uncharacterized protein n=1 Tax=Fusarium gaditjirri TaxID=282569 RepID=A0A8H4X3R6_9HYPO|nr:hypothetical protein FGADI_982 [Fusarium gaditjirri]
MSNKNLHPLPDAHSFTTKSEEDAMERFEEIIFKVFKLEVEKERDRRRIYKLSGGRDELKEILESTMKREEESKRKGNETQRQKSAELARLCKRELGKHHEEISRLEKRVVGLNGRLLELKELRNAEKMRYNSEVEFKDIMVENGAPESIINSGGPKEMPEPIPKNQQNLQGKPWGSQCKSEQVQSDEDDSKENKPFKGEANGKSAKKVRFQEDAQRKDSEKKESLNKDNHNEHAPTSSNISLWDGETIKEMERCLNDAEANLKIVQKRLKKLEHKKKALLAE